MFYHSVLSLKELLFGEESGETAAHLALLQRGELPTQKGKPNSWGFYPGELADLLGYTQPKDPVLKFVERGQHLSQKLDSKQVQEKLHFTYVPHIRFRNYQELKGLIRRCPILFGETLPSPKRRSEYLEKVWSGTGAEVSVVWFGEVLGYGVVANQHLKKGDFVGTYTGEVRRIYRKCPDPNDYCLHYPTRFWSLQAYVIDALRYGNATRFINHSDQPNLDLECLVDRGLIHFIFLAKEDIDKATPLTFDYGVDFWHQRMEEKVPG